jgi:hypothetical protein
VTTTNVYRDDPAYDALSPSQQRRARMGGLTAAFLRELRQMLTPATAWHPLACANAEGVLLGDRWGVLTKVDTRDASTWTIANDELPGGYRVVTSFNLCRFGSFGPPQHFETAVIGPGGDGGDRVVLDTETYSTEPEALAGHDVIVSRIRTSVEARS